MKEYLGTHVVNQVNMVVGQESGGIFHVSAILLDGFETTPKRHKIPISLN
jgi:hypothetical protein